MSSRIAMNTLRIVLLSVLLLVATRTLKNPHAPDFSSEDLIFSKGNAPEPIRAAVLAQLEAFQEGYAARDVSRADEFAERLFSRENVLVLGTMPKEIYVGHAEATDLVRSDWQSWGDCRFLIDRASVSARGDVAWISTIGYVEFDLSRFLIMPLRLSGVMVDEDGTWRFQQLQFQFDLDLGFLLLLILIILVLLATSFVTLLVRIAVAVVRFRRGTDRK